MEAFPLIPRTMMFLKCMPGYFGLSQVKISLLDLPAVSARPATMARIMKACRFIWASGVRRRECTTREGESDGICEGVKRNAAGNLKFQISNEWQRLRQEGKASWCCSPCRIAIASGSTFSGSQIERTGILI